MPDPPATTPRIPAVSDVLAFTAHDELAPFSFARKLRLVPVVASLQSSNVCAPVVVRSNDVPA